VKRESVMLWGLGALVLLLAWRPPGRAEVVLGPGSPEPEPVGDMPWLPEDIRALMSEPVTPIPGAPPAGGLEPRSGVDIVTDYFLRRGY